MLFRLEKASAGLQSNLTRKAVLTRFHGALSIWVPNRLGGLKLLSLKTEQAAHWATLFELCSYVVVYCTAVLHNHLLM